MLRWEKRSVYALIIMTLFLLAMVAGMITLGKADTVANHKHTNSLGVVQYETNPYTYIEGSISNVARIDDAVNIRVQPRSTYGLFTQELLLCDLPTVAEKFQGKGGLVVLTYETVAHRTVQGIGCHRLVAVDMIQEERPNE